MAKVAHGGVDDSEIFTLGLSVGQWRFDIRNLVDEAAWLNNLYNAHSHSTNECGEKDFQHHFSV